jgi:hypothetical protein
MFQEQIFDLSSPALSATIALSRRLPPTIVLVRLACYEQRDKRHEAPEPPPEEQSPMKCPVCDVELRMTDRHGVEIDYCPQCRGVWLDRGELEKIVAIAESQAARHQEFEDADYDEDDDFHRRDDRQDKREGLVGHREGSYRGGRKREGFLSNLFDMFGD